MKIYKVHTIVPGFQYPTNEKFYFTHELATKECDKRDINRPCHKYFNDVIEIEVIE